MTTTARASVEVRRVVPCATANPKRGQIGRTGGIDIAAAHGNPAAAGDQCQRTHPGSADSHEVDGARIRGVKQVMLDALM